MRRGTDHYGGQACFAGLADTLGQVLGIMAISAAEGNPGTQGVQYGRQQAIDMLVADLGDDATTPVQGPELVVHCQLGLQLGKGLGDFHRLTSGA